MRNQNLFEALERICGFTALETDMAEIIAAHEKDIAEGEKHQPKTIFSGMDKYFDDLTKYENDFNCNECGFEGISEFGFERKVSNGEVWNCKHCNAEKVVGHKPNEDNY